MKNLKYLLLTWIFILFIFYDGSAQVAKRESKSFENPTVPATLIVEAYQGNIYVEGYNGKEVVVTAYNAEYGEELRLSQSRMVDRKVFSLEEKNNQMNLRSYLPEEKGPKKLILQIQVPEKTSLQISLQKGGDVQIQGTSRAVEIDNPQGKVRLEGLKGWAVVNSIEGDIYASFEEVVINKPMSFITLKGNIDLDFPKNLQAQFRMKTTSGMVHNEFGTPINQSESLTEANADMAQTLPGRISGNQITKHPKKRDKKEARRSAQTKSKISEALAPPPVDTLGISGLGAQLPPPKKSMDQDSFKSSTQMEKPKRAYQIASSYYTIANEGRTIFFVWARSGEVNIYKSKRNNPRRR